jgi:hypothetical protein
VNVRQFGAAPRQPLVSGANRSRNFRVAVDGAYETTARSQMILETPFLNKGSAFSFDERAELGLTGCCPPR